MNGKYDEKKKQKPIDYCRIADMLQPPSKKKVTSHPTVPKEKKGKNTHSRAGTKEREGPKKNDEDSDDNEVEGMDVEGANSDEDTTYVEVQGNEAPEARHLNACVAANLSRILELWKKDLKLKDEAKHILSTGHNTSKRLETE
ncbi:hypothetical protein Tco_0155801 [Tanacetum coccineum]